MNIRYKDKISIEFNNVLFLNGANKSGKTRLLKLLESGFNGELEDFYVNNNKIYKGDYQTVYIGDYNNFATDFKLTKTNTFKKMIYDDILEKVNKENILEKANEVFNVIDNKINTAISNTAIDNVKLNINIDSIDKVIEKFTDIYIDEYLLDEKITPRSTLRKLLINLTLLQIEKMNSDNIIVFIDDIDTSLDEKELFKLIKELEKNNNATFILTSCRNIYPYITDKKDIYKVSNNNCLNLENINSCIKEAIITNEYNKSNNKDDINSFIEENEYLINDEDINYFQKNIMPSITYNIGLIYCNDNLEIEINNPNAIINVKNELEKIFLEIIYRKLSKLVDNE